MKYLQTEAILGDNECAADAEQSKATIYLKMEEFNDQIKALPTDAPLDQRFQLILDKAYTLLELNRFEEAWREAQGIFDQTISEALWLRAVECCDIMFQADQPDSLKALAHGIWLGVTFPIDPELSVAMLQHLVDESPDRSDGAAVAAATANYIIDLRAKGKQREDLQFFAMQLLGQVARRHSQVEEQDIFEFWVQQLELDNPDKFLPRLAKVLDVLTDNDWWFNRDALREKIPEA